jgi:heme-degrading monooxygenase HmoA
MEMMTIVTHVSLKQGSEPQWDTAMRERLAAAAVMQGWVGGQLMMPLDRLNRRVIVGTWQTRADWEAWHKDPIFEQTRQRMEGLEEGEAENWWHEVLEDVRRTGT